ncbi:MAG: hypothetical protein DRK00_01550 [Thermoprotei archaeon]|nr:MAG: hypothetical protein DRK00_01550 [Thermoprotei archaeon]
MKLEGRPLTSLVGREAYRQLLGVKVFDADGTYVGYLKRVYVERRSGRARRLIIRLLDGRLLPLKPQELRLTPTGLLITRRLRVETGGLSTSLRRLEEAVMEIKRIRERILELDEAYIAGEMSRDTYLSFRSGLELKRRQLLSEVRGLVEELESQVSGLEEERRGLLSKLRSASAHERGEAARRLRSLRMLITRINELLETAKHELSLEMELDDFIESCLR